MPGRETGHGWSVALVSDVCPGDWRSPGVTLRQVPRPGPRLPRRRSPRRSATCRGSPSRPPCALPAPDGLGHRLGLLLVRTEDHDHVPAVLLRVRLHEAEVGHILRETLQQSVTELRPGLLATTEHDRDLDLVALLEEPDDVTLLGVIVVRVDLRPELHLLDDRVRLVLARLTGLHGRLVLELPVVHELAHGRTGVRRDLDEVEVVLLRKLQGLGKRDNPDLLTTGTDKSHLGNANPVVDAGLGADGSSSVAPRDGLADSRVTSLFVRPNRAGAQKMPRTITGGAPRTATGAPPL